MLALKRNTAFLTRIHGPLNVTVQEGHRGNRGRVPYVWLVSNLTHIIDMRNGTAKKLSELEVAMPTNILNLPAYTVTAFQGERARLSH